MDQALTAWADNQRALARALGLSVGEWLAVLEQVCERRTGLTAAVVGAGMAHGLGLGLVRELDPEVLLQLAVQLVDPTPPKLDSPLLQEAVRQAGLLKEGAGASRLKKRPRPVSTPKRGADPLGDSVDTPTADAPGHEDGG